MAFAKYANANIIKPDINVPVWDRVLNSSGKVLGTAFADRNASKIALAQYNPKDYMLSHCTIVASVDTEDGPGAIGRHLVGSDVVDRRYQDYYITPETSKFVNNNQDSWERKLLLSSFRTFVGGENYVEHLQIPEMSKGKIIDAAARDIGDSVYIDILVATHRKFKPLVASIQQGQLQTLSMGCNVGFTICSRCGNVAVDETRLCSHIKYAKGNNFIDELGKTRKVAELCGHVDSEPGSVKFIEASWVANPAFTGAVLRNILSEEEAQVYNAIHKDKVAVALSSPARTADPSQMARAARSVEPHGFDPRVGFDFGQQDEFEGAGDADPKEQDADPMEEAVKDLSDYLKDKAVRRLRDQMSEKNVPNDMDENQNDTLIKEASRSPQWRKIASLVLKKVAGNPARARRILLGLLHHKRGGWNAVRVSAEKFSSREVLAISRVLDALEGLPEIAGEARIYRTVLAVGGAAPYGNEESYLAACGRVLGRQPTQTEAQALIVKGKLFDLGR
jgi:hypothetical protein